MSDSGEGVWGVSDRGEGCGVRVTQVRGCGE